MAIDLRLTRSGDTGFPIGKSLQDQPKAAQVDLQTGKQSASQHGESAPFAWVACPGTDFTAPSPQPFMILRVNAIHILGIPFSTGWANRALRSAHFLEDRRQLPVIHLGYPATTIAQLSQWVWRRNDYLRQQAPPGTPGVSESRLRQSIDPFG